MIRDLETEIVLFQKKVLNDVYFFRKEKRRIYNIIIYHIFLLLIYVSLLFV